MNNIIALLTTFFITIIGYAVIWGFELLPRKDKLISFACSYGLGIGFITMQLYIYSRLNISWNKWSLIFPWILFVAVLFLKNREAIHLTLSKKTKLRIIDKALLAGIVLTSGYTIFEALLRPAYAWDTWVTWLLKSKVFFMDGKISPEVLNYIKVNYPLVINLLGTFVYIMIGSVDDTAVLLTSSAFYIFTAILLFAVLKKKYGSTYSLLFTFLLVTTQNFVRHGGRLEAGLADLPIGYYSFCSVILLFEYFKKNSSKVFLLLNIFLGITGIVKFDGIAVAIAIAFFSFHHIHSYKLYKQLSIAFFWIVPIVDWEIYQRIYHLKDTYFSVHVFEVTVNKTLDAFWGTFKELVNVKSWNLLWIIYFYSLFAFKKNNDLIILNVIILSQLGVYMGMFLFAKGSNPEASIERLLMHLAPLVFYYMAIITALLFPSLKQKLNNI